MEKKVNSPVDVGSRNTVSILCTIVKISYSEEIVSYGIPWSPTFSQHFPVA